MIVSHKYKIVHLHIPKTGGSWANVILRKLDPKLEDIKNLDDGGERSGHFFYWEVQESKIYEKIKDYAWFSIIRNPLNTLASEYNYINTIEDKHYAYKLIKDKDIYEALKVPYVLANPQTNWLKDKEGNISGHIKTLNQSNLKNEFKQFLLDQGVPVKEIRKYKTSFNNKKENASKPFVRAKDIDITRVAEYFDKEDLLFYLQNS
jgi:hypothetical protein